MAVVEIYIIYNIVTGYLFVVKSKRLAERICSAANKYHKLIKSGETFICEISNVFFSNHHIEKSYIRFLWDIDEIEKMKLYRSFLKYKGYYDK
jgi:hypothetical protein